MFPPMFIKKATRVYWVALLSQYTPPIRLTSVIARRASAAPQSAARARKANGERGKKYKPSSQPEGLGSKATRLGGAKQTKTIAPPPRSASAPERCANRRVSEQWRRRGRSTCSRKLLIRHYLLSSIFGVTRFLTHFSGSDTAACSPVPRHRLGHRSLA